MEIAREGFGGWSCFEIILLTELQRCLLYTSSGMLEHLVNRGDFVSLARSKREVHCTHCPGRSSEQYLLLIHYQSVSIFRSETGESKQLEVTYDFKYHKTVQKSGKVFTITLNNARNETNL